MKKKKVTTLKLHKALHPSFIKRMYYMRFIGKFAKAEGEENGENFFVQCLSSIPLTLQELFPTRKIFIKDYKIIKKE